MVDLNKYGYGVWETYGGTLFIIQNSKHFIRIGVNRGPEYILNTQPLEESRGWRKDEKFVGGVLTEW